MNVMIWKLKEGNKMTQKRCSSLLLHSGLPSSATISLRVPSSQTVSSPLADPSLLPTKDPVATQRSQNPEKLTQILSSSSIPMSLFLQILSSTSDNTLKFLPSFANSYPSSASYQHPCRKCMWYKNQEDQAVLSFPSSSNPVVDTTSNFQTA